MKKVLLIAFLLTLSIGTAIAQSGQGAPPGGHHPGSPAQGHNRGFPPGSPVDRLAEELGLADAQIAEITAIFEDAKMLHEEERETSHEVFCAIRAETRELVLAVLTPDQQATFEFMKAEREELRAQRMAEHEAGGDGSGRRGPPPCDV